MHNYHNKRRLLLPGGYSMSEHPDSTTVRSGRRVCGDPSHLMDVATTRQFIGAPRVVAILEDAADRAVTAGRVLEDTLITGPDDSGKQIIARALARDAAQRIVEIDAAWIRDAKHVARLLRSLEDRDALLVRRIDELRPLSLRMFVSLLGMRSLSREADHGEPVADCTVIATAVGLPRNMHVLRRMFPLQVELPVACAEARAAAAFRAVQALGVAGTPELRAAAVERVLAGGIPPPIPMLPLDIARLLASMG